MVDQASLTQVESLFNQYDRDQSGKLTIKACFSKGTRAKNCNFVLSAEDVCQILMDLNIKPRSVLEQARPGSTRWLVDSSLAGRRTWPS